MFGTIIDTDKDGNIKLNPRYFTLCPEIFEVFKDKNLGGPVVKYIVNVYDRKSIYRHLPYDVRKEDVCEAIFGKKTNPRLSSEKVLKAIDLYKYVQYDPNIDQYQSMVNKSKAKVNIYNAVVVTEDNFTKTNKMEADMQKSTEGLEKLKLVIASQEEERDIMGSNVNNLSFIEERLLKRKEELSR